MTREKTYIHFCEKLTFEIRQFRQVSGLCLSNTPPSPPKACMEACATGLTIGAGRGYRFAYNVVFFSCSIISTMSEYGDTPDLTTKKA
jgi:hypothetical protein